MRQRYNVMRLSADHGPSRILRDETVITHG